MPLGNNFAPFAAARALAVFSSPSSPGTAMAAQYSLLVNEVVGNEGAIGPALRFVPRRPLPAVPSAHPSCAAPRLVARSVLSRTHPTRTHPTPRLVYESENVVPTLFQESLQTFTKRMDAEIERMCSKSYQVLLGR